MMGYCPQHDPLIDQMTGRETLVWMYVMLAETETLTWMWVMLAEKP